MNSFCVDTLSLTPGLRPLRGVLRAPGMALAAEGERAAAVVLQQARAQADAILAKAGDEAAAATRSERQRVALEATRLLEGLRLLQAQMLDGVGELALELAHQAFERLVADTVPAERIAGAVRRVREEAPAKLLSAVLCVHPEDLPGLGETSWELRADARLAPGACRLEAASGEWSASFSLGAQELGAALRQQQAWFKPAPAGDVEES